ncbi:MAG TPA: ammonia channel protein, partial [Candidatus Saccharimonadales bacterium]|nr:ammonia channel protein [Candidatus Saccharimonadales bacterium]
WFLKRRPSVLGAASGMVAGLATITPASGFVTIPAAFCIGLAGGAVCYLAVTRLKHIFKYDDSLDVFGVHGIGSITGMLMLGFLANGSVNPLITSTFKVNGNIISLAGGMPQFVNQLKGVAFTIVAAGLVTLLLLKIVDAVFGLRIPEEEETLGLDLTQHGEKAYND